MPPRLGSLLSPAALLVALAGTSAAAQARPSEHASVAQTVSGTTLTIEYYRPVARGRDSLFGRVVHWGQTWTPGANWATTLDVDNDVRLEGQLVPKGKYGIWMIPQPPPAQWTLLLTRTARHFHGIPPDSSDVMLRLPVDVEQAPHTEVLTWEVPAVTSAGVTIAMRWGSVRVPLRLSVPLARAPQLSADELRPYLGTYRVAAGSTVMPNAPALDIELTAQDGRLHGHVTPPMFRTYTDFDLFPDGPQRFHPGFYQDGQLMFGEAEITLAFTVENGRATTLNFLGPLGGVARRGTRVR